MKRLGKIVLVLGLIVLAGGSIAWGGRAARGAWMRHLLGKHIDHALDYIDATPQQRALVHQVQADIQAKVKAHRMAATQVPEQLGALLAADTLDTNQLNALIDSKADELKAMAREITPEIAKVHDALTPAQRQKLFAKWKEMRAARLQRMQERQSEQGGFGGSGE
jgi:Spy/CpxP family protein refolding chaperone